MEGFPLLLKLLGSLALAALGYLIYAAAGWPPPLQTMVLERSVIGGALFLLGSLCAVTSVAPAPQGGEPDAPPPQDGEPALSVQAVLALLDQGDAQVQAGQPDRALSAYSRAAAEARALDRLSPDGETQSLLARALTSMGDIFANTGRLDAAVCCFEAAIAQQARRLEAQPGDAERKRDVFVMLERLGGAREALGHTAQALDLYRRSLPIGQSLLACDPADDACRRDLANARQRVAQLQASLGRATG